MSDLFVLYDSIVKDIKYYNRDIYLAHAYVPILNEKVVFYCREYKNKLVKTFTEILLMIFKDENTVKEFLSKEYYGYSLLTRILNIQINLVKDIRKLLRTMAGEKLNTVFEKLEELLISEKRNINSYYKKETFLISNEMQRAIVLNKLNEYKKMGITKVGWQLNQQYDKHEEDDICKRYAKLKFSIDNFPSMPHPNCKCMPIILN